MACTDAGCTAISDAGIGDPAEDDGEEDEEK
jgi:hypothetical protein